MVMRRGPGGNLGLFLLFSQLMNFGLENIPPVTFLLLGGQIAIFMEIFPRYFPSATAVCMSSYLVIVHGDWRRMVLGTFYHATDMHLYFNMISLLYKGAMLERKFGSGYFACLVGVFSALTSLTYVGLGLALSEGLEDERHLTACAVGFSGVLFALKVLTTFYSPPGLQYVMGFIPVPSKYIYWAELALIQLVTPNASFVGHLAGILVGVSYAYGPLKGLIDFFITPGPGMSRQSSFDGHTPPLPSNFGSRLFTSGRPTPANSMPNFWGSGYPRPTRGRRGPPPAPRQDSPPHSNSSSGHSPGDDDAPLIGSHFFNTPHFGSLTPSRESSRLNQPQTNGGGYPQGFESFPANDSSNNYNDYTGGLSEEEQYKRVIGLSQRSPDSDSGGSASRLYPDLDDLRARRTQFYNQ